MILIAPRDPSSFFPPLFRFPKGATDLFELFKPNSKGNQRGQVSTLNKSQWMDYGLASTERQL
jgi:hypothetical protein